MAAAISNYRGAWLAVGILVGVVAGGLMPHRPLHAVATDGNEGFALATGSVDNGLEAVYFLDSLTGDLKGAVLNPNNGKFTTFYAYNVLGDFKLQQGKNPKFLMVTGNANLRQGPSRFRIGLDAIYVSEITSGQVAAYAVPYDPSRTATIQPALASFTLLDRSQFRQADVRPGTSK